MIAFVPIVIFMAQALTPEAAARKAVDDFKAGRYAEARDEFRAALKSAPGNAGLWAYLGLAEGNLNDTRAAIADLEKARALLPRDPDILFDLGALYMRSDRPESAREMYWQGLPLRPDDLAANQNYSLLLMRAGRCEQALGPLKKLRILQPDSSAVRLSLIKCALAQGLKQDAEREIQSLVEAPGVSLDDRMKAAQMLVESHAPGAAEAVLKDTVRRYDTSVEAHAGLGKLLLDRNEYEGAVLELGRAAQLAPEKSGYSLAVAQALLLWKHYSVAFQFLQAVRPRFGTLPDFKYELGLALYGLSRYPEAIAEFTSLVRENPNADSAWFSLGNSWMSAGKLENAEACYRKAIALNQHNVSYYTALGQTLRSADQNRVPEAIDVLRKALALSPSGAEIQKELALCYERDGNIDRAETLLEQAVQERPDFHEAHVALARVLYKRHKKAEGDREKVIVARLEAAERARQEAIREAQAKGVPPGH